MGKLLSKIMKKLSADGPKRILMLGLDNAGKTTILYRMKRGEDFNTVPTVGKILVCFFYYKINKFSILKVLMSKQYHPVMESL
jgi:GTPase SAR1 family protein